jgi:glutamine amidotransferase
MIVIIDNELGNVRSIYAKIEQMGEHVCISHSVNDIENADKLILPGVGAFDTGMEKIRENGILEILNKKVMQDKIPILGICLGMQLLSNNSEEGFAAGFGFIQSVTKKFYFSPSFNLNIPHMGWNTIQIKRESPLLKSIDNHSRFYFVHSYHLVCQEPENIVAETSYGYDFPSIIQKDNIFGVQFHPEKSHKQGLQLIRNFVRI